MPPIMHDPAFLASCVTLFTMLLRWWFDRGDKKELKKGVDAVAEITAASHEKIVKDIAHNTDVTEQGITTVTERAERAFTEANNFNLKRLEDKREISQLTSTVDRLMAEVARLMAEVERLKLEKTLHDAINDSKGAQ